MGRYLKAATFRPSHHQHHHHAYKCRLFVLQVTINTLQSVLTDCPADTVEWCPANQLQQYLLCGTYHLEEQDSEVLQSPARRKGRIYVFEYDADCKSFERIEAVDTAAILDLKWNCFNASADGASGGDQLVAAANALGEVLLYRFADRKLHAMATTHLETTEANLLTLSIDWNCSKRSSQSAQVSAGSSKLLASDSKGNVSLLQLNEASLDVVSTWSAHSFEAWTCCFDRWSENVVYTGGDDVVLHVFDTRVGAEKVMSNRSHMAGVTALLSFDDNEYMLASGSYDESLRLFDTRNFQRPLCEENLGGGIWRIKQNPQQRDLLLVACMYHNFSVVEIDGAFERLQTVGTYGEHESICYGADWCRLPEKRSGSDGDNVSVMATCSFYDHKLNISSVTRRVAAESAVGKSETVVENVE